jgi:DNA modification methylase
VENRVIQGRCEEELPKLKSNSFDCVVTDPIYPCISRDYGKLSEKQWHAMMDVVVPECRRVLRPSGSAVFILQPNSAKAGQMRLWLYEFIAKWGREWNLVQDHYWWNYATLPTGGSTTKGLLRGSVKLCVWLGAPDCYRNQDAVLWSESEVNERKRRGMVDGNRATHFTPPAFRRTMVGSPRLNAERAYNSAAKRGGVTPFNLIPCSNTSTDQSPVGVADLKPHPARTPAEVTDFWVRYLCPPGGSTLDPFCGSGTTLRVAIESGRKAVGIEADPDYAKSAELSLNTK